MLVPEPADLARAIGAAVPGEELARWLKAVGFPGHALLVRPHAGGEGERLPRKGLATQRDLMEAVLEAMERSSDGCALLETDMRAHCNPTRMRSIRRLGVALVRRMQTPCPECGSPGWGLIDTQAGLPCSECGTPTELTLSEIWGCETCGASRSQPRRDGRLSAEPGQCPWCNP